MSNLIQLQKGSKSYGSQLLFEDATFAVNTSEHVGVIGPNGAGKSTLFKMLMGTESLDSGQVIRSQSLVMGFLEQHDSWSATETVENYLEQNCITPLWDLKSLGKKLGLTDQMFSQPLSALSGGYRMRCKLLYLIGMEPDLMLLDEPTNYLDLETLLVLEKFLQTFRGAFLLISHDREFLKRTTDHILEVEAGAVTKFNGNIDDYFEQKALLHEQLEKHRLSQEAKRKEVLDFAARFGAKATKARQVQSRLKSLDKMESIEVKRLPVSAVINLPAPPRTPKRLVSFEQASLGYGEKVILKDISFHLEKGNRIGVVGYNGAGKSTFLKGLANFISPLSGERENAIDLKVGYYGQHVNENLDLNQTVLQSIESEADPSLNRQEILNLAGALMFSNDKVEKKISVLSGGERARVALAQILAQKCSCLLLDEPTNHLDFHTVESLTQALEGYPGTVVVVSHDRGFIRRVATQILEIRDGSVSTYPGSYDEYVWSLQKGALSKRTSAKNEPSQSSSQNTTPTEKPKVNYKQRKKFLEKSLRENNKKREQLEKDLEENKKTLENLNQKLRSASGADAASLSKELAQIQSQIDEIESSWLEIQEVLENFQEELDGLKN